MHIKRLRLLGFKSFVEPAELVIEHGLTGVVGPNGCGKSNLLEALRWVMGETSYKSMRASTMDDVIFSGSQSRPSRNAAEVTIFLDNSDRRAPPEFNNQDHIEVTRRIEREAGSAYRINGQEARARDVKILFEDAATGARSPSLVRQGQIAEIVNAKPSDRRRILEDAAGIAGLHSRRHEAELRLQAAENNLARLQDVLGQLNSQIEGLKRQSRAAKRYKELSAEIRGGETLQLHLGWADAQAVVIANERALEETMRQLGTVTQVEARATRIEADLAGQIQPLREEEAVRGAVLQRLNSEADRLQLEASQAQRRSLELNARLEQLRRDQVREQDLITEARDTLSRFDDEAETIEAASADQVTSEALAGTALAAAHAKLGETEHALGDAQGAIAEERARRRQLEGACAEKTQTAGRLARELASLESQAEALRLQSRDLTTAAALTQTVCELTERAAHVEEAALDAEQKCTQAAQALRVRREASAAAALAAGQLTTEAATLRKILMVSLGEGMPPIVDQLRVARGYEIALGAALGDDLSAPADEACAAHWRTLAGPPIGEHAPLPENAKPLSDHVDGAPELTRRLAQIGVVTRDQGRRMQPLLKPGQRLVTKQGDLWRWDGFVAAANAPNAAVQRLAERNRLVSLEADAELAQSQAQQLKAAELKAAEAHRAMDAREKELRAAWRQTQTLLASSRDQLRVAERAAREVHEKLAALGEARSRTAAALDDAVARKAEAGTALAAMPPMAALEATIQSVRDAAQTQRSVFAEARALVAGQARERSLRDIRRAELARERERWTARTKSAHGQLSTLDARIKDAAAELTQVERQPAAIAQRRQALLSQISTAEQARAAAAIGFAEAEAALKQALHHVRDVREQAGQAREARARVEATLESARTRRTEQARLIREALDCAPEDCLRLAGIAADAKPPALADVERQLQRLRTDRERLGGVNLSAEAELNTLSKQHRGMDQERADLDQAIAKLRGSIGQLNREGRKRLMVAFETVNGHFQQLFTTLFNGGEAKLEMIEGEDPLESGLEIVARPPGKKANVLSLLSGGEQTLTALSLIFAVFLTNPSPICVLDEVDAPLDDANVDRFCALMEHMARDTATRFLVITHHPMTMARMNRLFGVTMAEKGVSQLVSVDLTAAELFREAG